MNQLVKLGVALVTLATFEATFMWALGGAFSASWCVYEAGSLLFATGVGIVVLVLRWCLS